MPMRQITPMRAVQDYLTVQITNKEREIINSPSYIGEQCINEARTGGNYMDRTGNLRSSIGYVIVKDGQIVQQSSFQQVKQGAKGTKDGETFAKQIASKFPKGICMIVVAGMNYAGSVSAKGFNVLDSSESLVERLVPQLIKQFGFIKK